MTIDNETVIKSTHSTINIADIDLYAMPCDKRLCLGYAISAFINFLFIKLGVQFQVLNRNRVESLHHACLLCFVFPKHQKNSHWLYNRCNRARPAMKLAEICSVQHTEYNEMNKLIVGFKAQKSGQYYILFHSIYNIPYQIIHMNNTINSLHSLRVNSSL